MAPTPISSESRFEFELLRLNNIEAFRDQIRRLLNDDSDEMLDDEVNLMPVVEIINGRQHLESLQQITDKLIDRLKNIDGFVDVRIVNVKSCFRNIPREDISFEILIASKIGDFRKLTQYLFEKSTDGYMWEHIPITIKKIGKIVALKGN